MKTLKRRTRAGLTAAQRPAPTFSGPARRRRRRSADFQVRSLFVEVRHAWQAAVKTQQTVAQVLEHRQAQLKISPVLISRITGPWTPQVASRTLTTLASSGFPDRLLASPGLSPSPRLNWVQLDRAHATTRTRHYSPRNRAD